MFGSEDIYNHSVAEDVLTRKFTELRYIFAKYFFVFYKLCRLSLEISK